MPVTVVVGGQFGGEGKGKVAHFLAQEMDALIAVRVGGSNSGHTALDSFGNAVILRQLPTAALLPDVACVLSAGSYIDVDVLLAEIEKVGLSHERLFIDPNAVIISEQEQLEEKNSSLRKCIGSTLSGTGAALLKRISRSSSDLLAKNETRLQQYIRPVAPFLRERLAKGERIIIEGTQGFGLSLLHSQYYPYATSRDTTAATFVAEAGLSPLDVDDIVMVLRAFPIRVAGNSGPLPNEIDWETLTTESKSGQPLIELTSVTKTKRRVARFDADLVRQAIMINQPSRIVMNHLDYIEGSLSLTNRVAKFVVEIECSIGRNLDYLGFGPSIMAQNTLHDKKLKVA